ncbi:MAG TPA: hypothetical protein VEY08_00080 [Chloroflexia bacterium]|nr:hypothetical protein [Chloroflexia bacterium]
MIPSSPAGGQKNTGARLALVLLLVALVAGGLLLLAFQYPTGRPGVAPSPTPAAATGTPQLSGTQTQTPPQTPTHSPTGLPASPTSTPSASHTPLPVRTSTVAAGSLTPTFTPASLSAAERTLQVLDAEQVPVRDLYSITLRLRPPSDVPLSRIVDSPPANYPVGHTETFFMSDIVARRYYTITATLRNVTEHVHWYVQDGQQVDDDALHNATREFEDKIYPANHRLFGTEWVPGVDNDPRMTVLIANIPGAGGYYVSADEYTQAVNPFSNQREIIYVNTSGDASGLGSTLAHEFQHMIHWHQNPGHDVWLNEGASMLAQDINGYGTGGVEHDFVSRPDVQLNAWQASPDASRANYGASFLFFEFLRSHYGGDDVLRAVVAAEGRGADAVDNALASLGSQDRFLDVFKRWTLANLLDREVGAQEQGFDYPGRDVGASPQHLVSDYPRSLADTVSQFGTDYVQLSPPEAGGTLQIDFTGQAETRPVPAPAHSGEGIWWSNRGDQADSSLTRRFDLRSVSRATLHVSAWFRIEDDLDYAYVEASSDNGVTWTTLQGDYTTTSNPNGNNLGHAYTGDSAAKPGAGADGWLQEQIDLTEYAGKEVLLRFEYVTDDGFNTEGIAVDDISIPEIGYQDDAEAESDWDGEGFARIANKLPQTYHLAVVKYKDGGFDIQEVEVGQDGKAGFEIEGLGAGGPYTEAVLVISGTARHSISPAGYQLNIRVKP